VFCELKSQDISGKWYSKTTIDEEEFHFLFDIRKKEKSLIGYIDIPFHNIFRIQTQYSPLKLNTHFFCERDENDTAFSR